MAAPINLVVHGHFYQPPRENPFTDQMPREPTAAPYSDWNARIHAECYRPNAFARLHGTGDRLQGVVNNYARLSFNFGPTLARWIERHDPWTLRRLADGDREQRIRTGHGGALAQVWGHPIAPLLSPGDLRTQILWGQQDFFRRFGRPTEGMWLPETAADPATLEALIEAGVTFTLLAPEQIAAVRAPGGSFVPVTRDTIDTGRAYRWAHRDGSGRSIALGIFDGPMSREIAFGTAARDADSFLQAVENAAARSSVKNGPLVLVASDGELYGHHKKFADLTLAYALSVEADARDIDVSNLGAYLAKNPPTWDAQLGTGPGGEGTAWSCSHGLGRWQRHCGCAMRAPAETGWSQAWRGPLREALDTLRDRTHDLFEDVGADLFLDPWGTRDHYGAWVDAPLDVRRAFLRDEGRPGLSGNRGQNLSRAMTLVETMRSALAMYASCAWFFDDIGGLESAIGLRQATYVLHGWKILGIAPPVDTLLDVLAKARSNEAGHESGADIFRRILGQQISPARVAAAAGILRALNADCETPLALAGHEVRVAGRDLVVTALRSGCESRLVVTVADPIDDAPVAVINGETFAIDSLPDDLRRPVVTAWIKWLGDKPTTSAFAEISHALDAAELPRGGSRPAAPVDVGLLTELEKLGLRMLSEVTATGPQGSHTVLLIDRIWGAFTSPPVEFMLRAQDWIGERLMAQEGTPVGPDLARLATRAGFNLQ